MKVLYTSSEIRRAIAHLFSTSTGRRVAIAAFVGADAETYLNKPAGIQLVCWPKAGGTNPKTIRRLKRLNVDVGFADALHMKLYWTDDEGAVITSANLSTYALGSGGLKEIGVLLPAGKVDIDRVLASINFREATDREISHLESRHKIFWRQNPQAAPREYETTSFAEWYDLQPAGWKLAGLINSEEDLELSSAAEELLQAEHGGADYSDLLQLTTREGKYYRQDDWLLSYSEERASLSPVRWVYAHYLVRVPYEDKKAYHRGWPYQLIQAHPLRHYEPPPFVLDHAFKKALPLAVREYGGFRKLDESNTRKPTRRLLALLHKHYQRQAGRV